MRVYKLDEIKRVLDPLKLIKSQKDGFVAYSQGRVVVPPVGYLHFDEPPGDCHIKYGYIKGDDYFVVKIATGFYRNPDAGLPAGNGMMALFSQKTGELEALLMDEGYLTDKRTAAAGAVVAEYLAPTPVKRIGIVGAGVQARMQLEMLKYVTDCREVCVWGRDIRKTTQYKADMDQLGFVVQTAADMDELTESCNLIVTTTASKDALLHATQIKSGTHITAVGADAPGKQELEPQIFKQAGVRAVDSITQCVDHGDAAHAIRKGLITRDQLVELGAVISNPQLGRTSEDQITVADLTGVAVQDIEVAKLAFQSLTKL